MKRGEKNHYFEDTKMKSFALLCRAATRAT